MLLFWRKHRYSFTNLYFKGSVPRDLWLQVFIMNHCPPSLWYCSCRRHWHRWQIYCRCRWYRWQFATGVINTRRKFAAGIADNAGKFAIAINNTNSIGGKIYRRCRWYRWCTLTCEYFPKFLLLSHEQSGYLIPLLSPCTLTCEYFHKFLKTFQNDPTVLSGAWGKMKPEAKISLTLYLLRGPLPCWLHPYF